MPALLVLLIAACAASEGESEPSPIEVIAEHGVGDGYPATEVPIGNVTDIAVDGAGNVYSIDAEHHRVRKVGTDGVVTTVLNANDLGLNRHGITGPSRIALGEDGTLYVADASTGRVWAVIDGTPVYFAGSGAHGDAGDEGPAVDAEFRGPSDVDVGPDGTVFIADLGNHRVRAVGTNGQIRTVAGGDLPPDTGYSDGVASTSLFQPELIAAAPDGSLYVVDRNGARIERLSPDGSMEVVPQPGPSVSAIVISGEGHLLVMAGVLWRLKEEGWTRVFNGTEPERFSAVASSRSLKSGYLAATSASPASTHPTIVSAKRIASVESSASYSSDGMKPSSP